jgi:hypothetical protein
VFYYKFCKENRSLYTVRGAFFGPRPRASKNIEPALRSPSHDGGRPVIDGIYSFFFLTVYIVERSPVQGRQRNVYIRRSTASIDVRAVRASPSQATQVERDTPLLTGYTSTYADMLRDWDRICQEEGMGKITIRCRDVSHDSHTPRTVFVAQKKKEKPLL